MCDLMKKRSGVYRLRNEVEIEDFEFEVKLQQINSLLYFSFNSQPASTPTPTTALPSKSLNDAKNTERLLNDGAVLTTRLKWQEKLLSPSESTLYSDVKNCTTETQRKYHHWLTQATEQAGAAESTVRGKKRTKMRRRRQQEEHLIYTYVEVDDFVPNDIDVGEGVGQGVGGSVSGFQPNGIKRTPPDNAPYQHMYVYAALKPDTELLRLTWDPVERQLFVYPDFCQSQKQLYYMEIDSNCRHLYTYNCMNVTPMGRRSQERRRRRQRRQRKGTNMPKTEQSMWDYNLNQYRRQKHDDVIFSSPPLRSTRVTLFFELIAGQHFDYDNIHVRYHIVLPDHTVHEKGLLSASTHSSCGRQLAHFTHSWQVTLLCDELYDRHEQLHIYFEVIAIDGWSCERDEGYAHYSCRLLEPLTPSIARRERDVSMKLQCVRPAGNWLDALRRYFLGGRPIFDYVKYFRELPLPLPVGLVEGNACRGFPMLNTGQLLFKVTKLQQNRDEAMSLLNKSRRRRPLDMNYDDILHAYHEAQMRLMTIMHDVDNNNDNNNKNNNEKSNKKTNKCRKTTPKKRRTKQQSNAAPDKLRETI